MLELEPFPPSLQLIMNGDVKHQATEDFHNLF